MITINLRNLSRNERQQLGGEGNPIGDLAEQLVADEYGLNRFNDASWFDATDESGSGARYEVKSTAKRIGDDYPADGRFRLWEEQHRSLTTAEGQNMAWYAFVLLDQEAGEIMIQRKRPSTVTQIIQSRGGWNAAGHGGRDDRQHKVPYSAVMY